MDFFYERKREILIIVLLLINISLISVIFVIKDKKEEVVEKEVVLEEKVDVIAEVLEDYYVDIKGAVKKPGVYKISKGNMVNDVIKMAGGLKSNASTKYINLSYELKNHDVIYIYSDNEVKKSDIKEICVCPEIEINKCDNSSIVTNDGNNVDVEEEKEEEVVIGKVNINTASVEELMTLNGIGQSKAEAIIEYRNSNKFNVIEDLLNVSGIGEALYNKVKDNITV